MTWPEAVVKMAKWYETTIHTYQGTVSKPRDLSKSLHPCPLLGGTRVRDDCTGYVSACCQMIGALPQGYLLGSADAANSNGPFAKHVSKGGFKMMSFSMAALQVYDIIAVYKVVNGKLQHHAEIYAGPGKAFSWGNIHDRQNGRLGMPCKYTNYSYLLIYRHDGVSRDTPCFADGDYAGGGSGGTLVINLDDYKEPYPVHSEYETYNGKGGNIFEKAPDNAFSMAVLKKDKTLDSSKHILNYKNNINTRIYSTNDSKIILDELKLPLDTSAYDNWANQHVTETDILRWQREMDQMKEEAKKRQEEEAKKALDSSTNQVVDTSINDTTSSSSSEKPKESKSIKKTNSTFLNIAKSLRSKSKK